MMVAPKFSLKSVSLFGVTLVMSKEDTADFVKAYPEAKVKSYSKGRSSSRLNTKPSAVRSISPEEYKLLQST